MYSIKRINIKISLYGNRMENVIKNMALINDKEALNINSIVDISKAVSYTHLRAHET